MNEHNNSSDRLSLFDFQDVFKGVRKLLPLFLALLVLISAVLCAYTYFSYVPYYTSTATFTITLSGSYGSSNSFYYSTTAAQLAKTFPYILQSGTLGDMIAADLGTDSVPGSISVHSLENTNIFTMTVSSSDPENAYRVLMSAIDNYPDLARFVVGDTVFTLINEPEIPSSPANSRSYRSAVRNAMLISLVLYALAVTLYVLTRSTVRRTEDIKRMLNVKCIGTVPFVKLKKRGKNGRSEPILITNKKLPHSFSEGIRLIRTKLEREGKGKTVLVTSACENEGKSTVAVNLALSLAEKGYQTLLIDCDLRNPSCAKILGIGEPPAGLGDYLAGKAPLSKLGFKLTAMSGLMLIPGRGNLASAAESLDTSAMKKLIDSMRNYVDFIILDTTPCAVITDAAVLAKQADEAVFVVRQDYASKDRILDGVSTLSESGVPILGCVFNAMQSGGSGYGGYYGRYSYSRYAYGSYGSHYGKYNETDSSADTDEQSTVGRPDADAANNKNQ